MGDIGFQPDTSRLVLRHPTENEKLAIWSKNFESWGKALTLPGYLERERYLATIPLNAGGGLTNWILVDESLPEDDRPILASCETVRKRVLLTLASTVEVQEAITHGIGSVFCYPEHRGKGYPRKMLDLLGKELETWQTNNKPCFFSILYSDIGKGFYAKHGWHPYSSKHIALTPSKIDVSSNLVTKIGPSSSILESLCQIDEHAIRMELATQNSKAQLSLIPDYDTLRWHHLREDFITTKLFGRSPEIKGAVCGEGRSRVWAVWTRCYYGPLDNPQSGNTLYILRFFVEDKNSATNSNFVKAILNLARSEALAWKCDHVQLWNPTEYMTDLVNATNLEYRTVDREDESVPSLKWYGPGDDKTEIEWLHNEKFGWC